MCSGIDVNEKQNIFLKHGSRRVFANRKRVIGTWTLRFPKGSRLSPVRFVLRLGAKVASAIRFVSMRKKSSCRKVSSSSSSSLVKPIALLSDNTDSHHRAKAVQDCIEFLHSSSSRERLS